MTMHLNLNNMRLFFLIFLINLLICSVGCKRSAIKTNLLPLNQRKKSILLADQKKDSTGLNTVEDELLFKRWLKDTLLVLKQNKLFKSNDIITINSRYIDIYKDSTSFIIRTIIDDTIDFKIKYPIETDIGSTLYSLERNGVKLPKKPFEFKIDVIEMYGLSSSKNLIYDKSYEYNYISVRPLSSKIETYFSIMKGNLTQTLEKESSSDWFLKDR